VIWIAHLKIFRRHKYSINIVYIYLLFIFPFTSRLPFSSSFFTSSSSSSTLRNQPKSIEFLVAAVNIFSFNCTRYNYIIILGFPIVPHDQLATRIKDRFNNRAESTGTRLVKNSQKKKNSSKKKI